VAFVTLGGKPPRWLSVALELPSLWRALGKFVKVSIHLRKERNQDSEVRKAVERDPAWS